MKNHLCNSISKMLEEIFHLRVSMTGGQMKRCSKERKLILLSFGEEFDFLIPSIIILDDEVFRLTKLEQCLQTLVVTLKKISIHSLINSISIHETSPWQQPSGELFVRWCPGWITQLLCWAGAADTPVGLIWHCTWDLCVHVHQIHPHHLWYSILRWKGHWLYKVM